MNEVKDKSYDNPVNFITEVGVGDEDVSVGGIGQDISKTKCQYFLGFLDIFWKN